MMCGGFLSRVRHGRSLRSRLGITILQTAILAITLRASPLPGAMDRATPGRPGAARDTDVGSGRIPAAWRLEVAARRLAPPGSTVKPFTLLAASAASLPTLVCRRQLRLGLREIDCTHPASPEPLGAVAALAYSCNSYF